MKSIAFPFILIGQLRKACRYGQGRGKDTSRTENSIDRSPEYLETSFPTGLHQAEDPSLWRKIVEEELMTGHDI